MRLIEQESWIRIRLNLSEGWERTNDANEAQRKLLAWDKGPFWWYDEAKEDNSTGSDMKNWWKVKLIAWSWATSQKAQIQCVGFPNITKMRCLSCLMLIQKLIGYVYAIIFDACPLLSEGVDCWVRSILDMLVKVWKYVAFVNEPVWYIVNVKSEMQLT